MIRVLLRKAAKNLPDSKFFCFSQDFKSEEPRKFHTHDILLTQLPFPIISIIGQSSYTSKKKRLRKELYENPEFDRAFPHLAENKPLTKIPRKTKEPPFISSLL